MVRRTICLGMAFLAIAGVAAAEDDDGVMGVWKGSVTSSVWQGRTLKAENVALGEGQYRLQLHMAPSDGAKDGLWPTIYLEGYADEGVVRYVGEIPALEGESCRVEAEGAPNQSISGTIKLSTGAEPSTFKIERVKIEPPTLGAKPPEGAVVLFDGTNLDKWVTRPEKWSMGDGAMQVSSSGIVTTEEFGSAQLHVEFMTPFMPGARGQGRGNSGVYVQGRYEVQVLDSFGDPAMDNLCGGIYKIATPRVNACLPPLTWQTYDITFHAPKFDASGKKTENAHIHVVHNGIVIHDNLTLPTLTAGGVSDQESATGPLFLQHHGNPVKYRNIWVKPLN